MDAKKLKIFGLIATVAGAGISIASSIIAGKSQKIEINDAAEKAVAKALAEKTNA